MRPNSEATSSKAQRSSSKLENDKKQRQSRGDESLYGESCDSQPLIRLMTQDDDICPISRMALPYDPNFTMACTIGEYTEIKNDQEHDESASAAMVAVDLISSARLALKLDSVYTEYSAQYLVDNAGSHGLKLTVKNCLEFVLNKGIPKAEDWPHLGSVSKPPSSHKPALVSMKGQVIEAKNLEEVCDLLVHQPVGAKLHVFSPQIELQQNGIYCGSSGEPASYVGLRDGVIVGVENIQGKSIATVKIWYKKKFTFFKVALSRMFFDESIGIGPTGLLVDFCVPRLSIN